MKTKTLIAILSLCIPAAQAIDPPVPPPEETSTVTTRAYVSTDARGNTVYGTYTQNLGASGVGTGYIKSGDGRIYDVMITPGVTRVRER